jgi:hypothetical protein
MPIPQETIDEIKARAKAIETTFSQRGTMFKRYREMYFMDNMERPKDQNVDKNDWALTASPTSRNEVTGMKRLLDTSELQVKVLEGNMPSRNSDKIEAALKRMLDVSGEGRDARVESDAMLSAVLYGPVVLAAEAIQDSLTIKGIPEYKKNYLQKQAKRSPFIIRAINPEESYIERDEGLVTLHLWKYKLLGGKLKSRWGVAEAKGNTEYTVWDVFTPEYHLVWADGIGKVLYAEKHNLNCVPITTSTSGGTELFHKPEERINSFLFAKAKADIDRRENMVLTALFTQIKRRGLLGSMYWIDPENAPDDITINYQNGVMYAKGKVTAVNDKIIDPIIMQAKQLLDELSGESTIRGQTLGDNAPGSTFSALAMLSSAGKLPMVDSQRALGAAFRDIFLHILYRIKTEVIQNTLIEPMDIPDDIDLEVTFEPRLPQDQLRNAQVAASLGDKVSTEWIHTNLLQINDTPAMEKQIAKEVIKKSMLAKIVEDPQIMGALMQAVVPRPPTPPAQPNQQPVQEQPAMEQPGMAGAEGINPEMMAQLMAQGGMEQMPKSGPMIPPQERM